MALRKPVTNDTEAAVETAPETVAAVAVEAAPQTEPAVEEAKAQAAAKVEEPKAAVPAVRKSTEVGAVAPSFFKTNPITEQVVAEAMSGDFPTIVATSGTFKISGEKIDIGKSFTFQALGAKRKFVCAPNDPSDSAKEFFAAAYEGDMAKDGLSIDQWVEDAQAAGFSKAKKAEYLDIFVEILDHEDKKRKDLVGEVMVLQLSFMSMKEWKSFANALRIKYSWGDMQMEGSPVIRATAEATSNKAGNDYTKFLFSLA